MGTEFASSEARHIKAMRAGLRDLGYVEGKNIALEFRWADGNVNRLPKLAAELVGLNVAVIVTHGTPGALAAKRATLGAVGRRSSAATAIEPARR